MAGSGAGGSFLRQLSGRGSLSSSKRWIKKGAERSIKRMDGLSMVGGENGMVLRKRVMVVVDSSKPAKHAVMWALTHIANKGDVLTLLEIIPPQKPPKKSSSYFHSSSSSSSSSCSSSSTVVSSSLESLCKSYRPEVKVEALVIHGPRLQTVLSQVKKLEVSVLVLGQKSPSPINCLFRSSYGDFVEQCINNADCIALSVRKQSRDVGGFLINSRWQKNFWLLA